MEILRLELRGNMTSNCYVLIKYNNCIVIDPGFEDDKLYNFLNNKKLNVDSIILTHGHYDHWGGLKKLRFLYPKALLYASTVDEIWFSVGELNRNGYEPLIDVDLSKLKSIELLGESFKIIKTPGHSSGSVSIHYNNHLFAGDVLFRESIGRADLPQGDKLELFKSIQKIYKLDENTHVHPGHSVSTTIKHEKAFNPFVRG